VEDRQALSANQLTCHEGLGLSQMLSQAAGAADETMPAAAGDQPWQAYCDADGSLLPEHTLPRSLVTPETRAPLTLVAGIFTEPGALP
jgi:hypothetical protein